MLVASSISKTRMFEWCSLIGQAQDIGLTARHLTLERRGLELGPESPPSIPFEPHGSEKVVSERTEEAKAAAAAQGAVQGITLKKSELEHLEQDVQRLRRAKIDFIQQPRPSLGRPDVYLRHVKSLIKRKNMRMRELKVEMQQANPPSRQPTVERSHSAPMLRRRGVYHLPVPPIPDMLEAYPVHKWTPQEEQQQRERTQRKIQGLNTDWRQTAIRFERKDRNARHLERLEKESHILPPNRLKFHLERYRMQRALSRQHMDEVVRRLNQLGPTTIKDQRHLQFSSLPMAISKGKFRTQDLGFDLKAPKQT